LAEVSKLITADAVADTVALLDRALRDSGLQRPRIAVAALNPHAGENGHFGREEIDLITPGIEKAAAAGVIVSGPFPSDTIFGKATAGEFDGVVTMYHDQGQIAMKLIGFDRGVTVQGGLPIPITTPAHGTAFDIVGKRRADAGAMQHAFRLAARLARHRRRSTIDY
jgi:4-hydroxythreonine-4-phosphate dehydrogenase